MAPHSVLLNAPPTATSHPPSPSRQRVLRLSRACTSARCFFHFFCEHSRSWRWLRPSKEAADTLSHKQWCWPPKKGIWSRRGERLPSTRRVSAPFPAWVPARRCLQKFGLASFNPAEIYGSGFHVRAGQVSLARWASAFTPAHGRTHREYAGKV